MDKETIKDTMSDLFKIFAILLGVVGFFGAVLYPNILFFILFLIVVAGLHLWVIYKIIIRYKDMTRSQRKTVLYYVIFLCLGIILATWSCQKTDEDIYNSIGIGFALIGSSLGLGRRACEMDEE